LQEWLSVAHAGRLEGQLGKPVHRLPVLPEVGAQERDGAAKPNPVGKQRITGKQRLLLLQVEAYAAEGVARCVRHPQSAHDRDYLAVFDQLMDRDVVQEGHVPAECRRLPRVVEHDGIGVYSIAGVRLWTITTAPKLCKSFLSGPVWSGWLWVTMTRSSSDGLRPIRSLCS